MIGVFREDDRLGPRLVVILRGFPCGWGRCSFCPFILEQSASTGKVIKDNREIIDYAVEKAENDKIDRIAVFNGGSFHELPLDTILNLTRISKNRIFEIEERSEYVTPEHLHLIHKLLKPRKLIVRVGFETAFEEIRENILHKGMPDSEMHRLSKLRLKLRREGIPIEIWTYLLFGMEGISEDTVIESLDIFKRLFDGVIAIRYKKYLPSHPEPEPVSERLARILEEKADLVDWGGDEWVIAGKMGNAPG